MEETDVDKMLKAKTSPDPRKKQEIDYKTEIAKMLAHMEVVSKRISRNLAETEQLQAETRAILAEIQAG